MNMDRRTLLKAAGALVAPLAVDPTRMPSALPDSAFPNGFLWGAATAGHQVEGNNIASDLWMLEHTTPTVFGEPSGDAVNGFELWPVDLDLARSIGLNTYRFSLEWAR